MAVKIPQQIVAHIGSVIHDLDKKGVSYAQEYEDIILFRYLHTVAKGFYIDVGCNDPEEISVTRFFYDRGWNGINIGKR